jgi:hypothetical protein
VEVDLVDDLEVAGEQALEEWDGPLLESFGKDGVVSVAKLYR